MCGLTDHAPRRTADLTGTFRMVSRAGRMSTPRSQIAHDEVWNAWWSLVLPDQARRASLGRCRPGSTIRTSSSTPSGGSHTRPRPARPLSANAPPRLSLVNAGSLTATTSRSARARSSGRERTRSCGSIIRAGSQCRGWCVAQSAAVCDVHHCGPAIENRFGWLSGRTRLSATRFVSIPSTTAGTKDSTTTSRSPTSHGCASEHREMFATGLPPSRPGGDNGTFRASSYPCR